jgi:helicase required for RNAi-mediated heterochromatin assembly 1
MLTLSKGKQCYIKGFTFSPQGIAAKVSFSYKRAGKKIIWEQSKRLISGSLVALSPAVDGFQTTCVVAVVAARPLDGVKHTPPEIDIFFGSPEEIHMDPQQEWVMIEAKTGYYEAARHTLVALQKLTGEVFPLSEHFIRLRRKIAPPQYLQCDPCVNLSAAYPNETGDFDYGQVSSVDLINSWPESSSKHLDASQWSALRRILTKRLAIVQGPPGTGKTHVSVIALRILLENMKPDDPPIVIAAQTNHALDQLLLHVSQFEKNFIRLGGQTADTGIIKNRTLFEVRRSSPSSRDPPGCLRGSATNRQRRLIKGFVELLAPFQDHQTPLPADLFRDLSLITEPQYSSLISGAAQYVRLGDDSDRGSPMAAWLGDNLEPFFVSYEDDNFGFEDEEEQDLEFEQLKELEVEQGLTDDEDRDILRGQYIPVIEPFFARRSVLLTAKAIEKLLQGQDLWKIPPQARGAVYRFLQSKAKEILLNEFRIKAKAYVVATCELKIGKWERDSTILENTKLIGMTTTGFSKYRPLISSLKPRIVLIEEAAEIVEAPVTVTCVPSLQHLILVGDHKQLQGHCAQKDLEGEPFFLDVSLFERLVNNGMPFETLSRQRRMKPEIRRLLTPIYGELEDHEVVKTRADVPGMGGINSFFFCHSWFEKTDDYMSKCNDNEAEMIANFFTYLVFNRMRVDQITIMTFYNGQRKKILAKLRQQKAFTGSYFKVVTVDSYQGEENEIVLLSLVRSNTRRNIGFLSVENRVCVALSRAKRGFYIFGNAENLCHTNRMWWEVLKIMAENPRRVGFSLPLTCQNHGRKIWINDHLQFNSLTAGCDRPCPENLPCGHQCPAKCHPVPHSSIACPLPCRQIIPCGFNHQCIENCHVRPCRCDCFAEELDFDFQSPLDTFQHIQSALPIDPQNGYDGPTTPPTTAVSLRSQNSPSLLRKRGSPQQQRNGGAPRQPHSSRSSRGESYRVQIGPEDSRQAWGAFAAGGHVAHDAHFDAKAERRYRQQNSRYEEWLQNHVKENGGAVEGSTPTDGQVLPSAVTTNDGNHEGRDLMEFD